MDNIINFNKLKKKGLTASPNNKGEVENLTLNFSEFETITDDRLALAEFTTTAKQLINKGISPDTVYMALYRAGAFLSAQDEQKCATFKQAVHNELTYYARCLCESRLEDDTP